MVIGSPLSELRRVPVLDFPCETQKVYNNFPSTTLLACEGIMAGQMFSMVTDLPANLLCKAHNKVYIIKVFLKMTIASSSGASPPYSVTTGFARGPHGGLRPHSP
jgi:hypothetical protein